MPLALALSAAPWPCSEAPARDLGLRGQAWEIRETDLLEHLRAKAAAWAGNGGLDAYRKEAERRARRYVDSPPPVAGVVHAAEEKTRLFDPSLTVRTDIRDHQGTLIAKAGTRVNPLDHITLSLALAFIDGSDADQVAWALAWGRKKKIVLVKGPVLALMRGHRRRFYFDQKGLLIRRFAITAVPATVEQEGDRLRIREFPVKGEGSR